MAEFDKRIKTQDEEIVLRVAVEEYQEDAFLVQLNTIENRDISTTAPLSPHHARLTAFALLDAANIAESNEREFYASDPK